MLVGIGVNAQFPNPDIYQRIYPREDSNLITIIREFVDSLNSSTYTHVYKINIDKGEKIQYMFGGHPIIKGEETYAALIFPPVNDEHVVKEILQIADSLARTGGYNNLRIANRLALRVVITFSSLKFVYPETEDNRLQNMENYEMSDWQRQLSIEAAILDLKYCARLCESAAVSALPSFLYSPEIIEHIKTLFRTQPLYTREEAEMMAQAWPPVAPYDTTGYMELEKKYYTPNTRLDRKESSKLNFIRSLFKDLQRSNRTIEQFYDSLTRVKYARIVEDRKRRPFANMYYIMSKIGSKRIYAMAEFIDSLKQVGDTQYWRKAGPDLDADLLLARLRYKDYPQRQMDKYTYIMDTCINYLNNNSDLGRDEIAETMRILEECYIGLRYINIPESLYRMAPLLLIETVYHDRTLDRKYSIGEYFFNEIDYDILNLPERPEQRQIPKEFLQKAYQWMLDNKNNYELKYDLLEGGKPYQPKR